MQTVAVTRDYLDAVFPNWRAPVVFSDRPEKCLWGGRVSSKTTTFARYVAMRASFEPVRVVIGRRFANSVQASAVSAVKKAIAEMGLQSFWPPGKEAVRSLAGAELMTKGLDRNIGSIQSLDDIDIFWVDEAQFVPDENWRVIEPTFFRKEGFELLLSFNPLQEDHWTTGYMDTDDAAVVSLQRNWNHNEFFTSEENRIRLRFQKRQPEMYDHVYGGQFLSDEELKWISAAEWKRAERTPEQVSFSADNARWFIGVDGSTADDLYSAAYLGVLPDGTYLAKWRTWICREMLARNDNYQKWVAKGHMRVSGTDHIDQTPIRKQLRDDIDTLRPERVMFDRTETRDTQQFLKALGPRYSRVIEEAPQGYGLDMPLRVLRAKLRSGKFRHDGDPVAKWCAGNLAAVPKAVEMGQRKVDGQTIKVYEEHVQYATQKKGLVGSNKIDPLDALCDAIYGAEVSPPRPRPRLTIHTPGA